MFTCRLKLLFLLYQLFSHSRLDTRSSLLASHKICHHHVCLYFSHNTPTIEYKRLYREYLNKRTKFSKNSTNYTVKCDNRQESDDDGDMITKHMRIILSFSYIPEIRSLTNNTDHDSSGDVHFHFNYNVNTRQGAHSWARLLFRPTTKCTHSTMFYVDICLCVFLIGGLKIRPQF